MGDIRDVRLLWIKGALFVALGTLSTVILLIERPEWRVALLHLIAVWAFCRAYYFAFYVVHHYIDPSFHFAGLGSVIAYALRRRH